ncbi:MAG: hypothetical protein Terrestrivirus1_129 [Terrestrivirus sp.]|uniref:Uncharacterized protein n=1 Tax=Terrestrivirus sp. TaxID=2487775 RepID=A0A3G4ZK88_9VIRU|nr:MAG: hypothetical protein Terrestrivirus1_129 [Terrestrivirus sp.]
MLSYLARGVVRMVWPFSNTDNVPVTVTNTTQIKFMDQVEKNRPVIFVRFDDQEVNGKIYENTLTFPIKVQDQELFSKSNMETFTSEFRNLLTPPVLDAIFDGETIIFVGFNIAEETKTRVMVDGFITPAVNLTKKFGIDITGIETNTKNTTNKSTS